MFTSCIEAQRIFEVCWDNPAYTQIKLDDVDVNATLSHYTLDKPLHFTQKMLWDMETKKAWNPARYIPYVVREGSAEAWGKHLCSDGVGEIFVRASSQKQWLDPDSYEEIYEEVYVNKKDRLITFLGTRALPGRSGELTPRQPLFHVQHGVGGSEDAPLNTWRIVHLTDSKDDRLVKCFKSFNDPTVLPGFIKVYIERDLEVALVRK